MQQYKAEIISIGNEVLAGFTVNTNATFISQQLLEVGIPVNWITTIRDEHGEILSALKNAQTRADAVLVTGGLGPTPDDLTKKAICDYFQVALRFDEASHQNVKRYLESRNIKPSESNRNQAIIPDCDYVIQNNVGTAPGLVFKRDNTYYFFMPGVPNEMKSIVNGYILDFLKRKLKSIPVYSALLRTTGIPESRLYERLQPVLINYPEIQVSYLPRYIGVDLRFRLISADKSAEEHIQNMIREVSKVAGRYIFCDQEKELEQVVGELLTEKGLTLSTAESFSGGLIADQITNIPGSSNYFTSGLVTYSNQSKMELLGVDEKTLIDFGAVSSQTALEMVLGVQNRFNTDCAISTTGIAGPGGATDTKPVGLCYVAVRYGNSENVKEFRFGTNRLVNKKRGAVAGLEMLRRLILEL